MKFFLISMLITARRVFTSSRLSITSSLVPAHGRDAGYSHHPSGWILPTTSPGRFLAETRAPACEVPPGSDRTALPGRPNSLLTRQGTTEVRGPGVRPSPEVTCMAPAGREVQLPQLPSQHVTRVPELTAQVWTLRLHSSETVALITPSLLIAKL